MANTKYLKFGLRADKNLSDISSATAALNNILDDLSAQLDENGDPLRFTSADIFPLIGLSKKGLANNVTVTGQPLEFTDLAGTTAQATSVSNTLLDVEPRITIEDHINRFKVILGDPPWVDGGTGPSATIFSSDRINANTSDAIYSVLDLNPGTVDITIGNRYRIEDLGNISATSSSNGWNELAGTTGVTYAVGSFFTAVKSLATAGISGNLSGAQVTNITIPVGNSGTGAPNTLKASEVFTTIDDENVYDPLILSDSFWEDGRFNFSDKIHPEMTNTYGGVRWEGYQSGRYLAQWEVNCYFIIEEDLIDDPNYPNDNWTLLKAVTSTDVPTFGKVLYETSDSAVTRIQFLEESDYQRVCNQMFIILPGTGTESTVSSVYKKYVSVAAGGNDDYQYFADLDSDLAVSETTGAYVSFFWNPVNDVITTERFTVTVPPSGGRRKVRYTAWWPELPSGANYGQKRFYEDTDSSKRLSFDNFYKDGLASTSGVFTFPYFKGNRLHNLKQESNSKLVVDGRATSTYKAPQFVEDIFNYFEPSSVTSASPQYSRARAVKLVDAGTGRLQSSTQLTGKRFDKAEVGDWIVCIKNFTTDWTNSASKSWAWQIKEKVNDYEVFVDPGYSQVTGYALNEEHNIQIVSNTGLVGIFKKQALLVGAAAPTGCQLRQLNTDATHPCMNVSTNDVSIGDLIANMQWTGGTGGDEGRSQEHPLKIETTLPSATENTIVTSAHPQSPNSPGGLANSSNHVIGQHGISAIYSSKGLSDKTGANECQGVFGLEVSVNSPVMGSNQRIYVTELPTFTGAPIVYFYGSTSGTPVIPEDGTANGSTTISGTGTDATDGPFILLNKSITAEITAGTTIVVVPVSYGTGDEKYLNREYCVIPLNTAPPFGSTEVGMITPTLFKNLIARDIAFDNLKLKVPDADVVSLTDATNTNTNPNRYLSIYYNDGNGDVEYKALINDNIST